MDQPYNYLSCIQLRKTEGNVVVKKADVIKRSDYSPELCLTEICQADSDVIRRALRRTLRTLNGNKCESDKVSKIS